MFADVRFSELHQLLHLRLETTDPDARAEIDRRVVQRFGTRKAVLVSDMSGFSRLTQARGVIHFLALIQRMQGLCVPAIEAEGGAVIKSVADNLFALLPDPGAAARAARALHAVCDEVSRGRPPDERLHLSLGIGYGDILDIDQQDCFGDEVNLAFKLGEDIAVGGETLITAAAAAALPEGADWTLHPRRVHISGIDLEHFEVRFQGPPRGGD